MYLLILVVKIDHVVKDNCARTRREKVLEVLGLALEVQEVTLELLKFRGHLKKIEVLSIPLTAALLPVNLVMILPVQKVM